MRSSRSAGYCASRAARSPRGPTASWKSSNGAVAARTISDAHVMEAVREIALSLDRHGRRKLTPEGLYGPEDDRIEYEQAHYAALNPEPQPV